MCGRRWESSGTRRRTSSWYPKSSSATTCPGVSALARASTLPQGSTISESPPEWWPPGCSPTWLAATTNTWSSIARARISASQ